MAIPNSRQDLPPPMGFNNPDGTCLRVARRSCPIIAKRFRAGPADVEPEPALNPGDAGTRYRRSIIKNLVPEPEYAIQKVNKAMEERDLLFYPACGLDWEPIRCFSDRCRVFLYCDWHTSIAEFDQALLQVPINNPALNCLRFDSANAFGFDPTRIVSPNALFDSGALTPEEREAYQHSHDHFSNKEPWARIIKVIHVVKGAERSVQLIYLCAEGVTTYLELFNKVSRAPHCLTFKNCGAGCGFTWTDFRDYARPLGRVVEMNPAKPDYLWWERGDWPWNEVVLGDIPLWRRAPQQR
jgi:hypothetical protein